MTERERSEKRERRDTRDTSSKRIGTNIGWTLVCPTSKRGRARGERGPTYRRHARRRRRSEYSQHFGGFWLAHISTCSQHFGAGRPTSNINISVDRDQSRYRPLIESVPPRPRSAPRALVTEMGRSVRAAPSRFKNGTLPLLKNTKARVSVLRPQPASPTH